MEIFEVIGGQYLLAVEDLKNIEVENINKPSMIERWLSQHILRFSLMGNMENEKFV